MHMHMHMHMHVNVMVALAAVLAATVDLAAPMICNTNFTFVDTKPPTCVRIFPNPTLYNGGADWAPYPRTVPWKTFVASTTDFCSYWEPGSVHVVDITSAQEAAAVVLQLQQQQQQQQPDALVLTSAVLVNDSGTLKWKWPRNLVAPMLYPILADAAAAIANTTAPNATWGLAFDTRTQTFRPVPSNGTGVTHVGCQYKAPLPCKDFEFFVNTANVNTTTTPPLMCLALVQDQAPAFPQEAVRLPTLRQWQWGQNVTQTVARLRTWLTRELVQDDGQRTLWTGIPVHDLANTTTYRASYANVPIQSPVVVATDDDNSFAVVWDIGKLAGPNGTLRVVPKTPTTGMVNIVLQETMHLLALEPHVIGRRERGTLRSFHVTPIDGNHVCPYRFTANSGNVACKQLGYTGGMAVETTVRENATTLAVIGPACNGWESSLEECAQTPDPVAVGYCPSEQPAAVACYL